MKKLFYVPILLLCLLLFPVTAHAETTKDGFAYKLHSSTAVEITGYYGDDSHVTVPSTIDGKSVVKLADCAFFDLGITEITLPDSIFHIGERTFQNCSNLEYINLTKTITFIGANAFNNCSSLKEIVIPPRISILNKGTFANCTNLSKVTFETEYYFGLPITHEIAAEAFRNCSQLKEITIPDGIWRLGDYAFAQCANLEKVTYLNQAENFNCGSNCFDGCPKLITAGFIDEGHNIEFVWNNEIPFNAFRTIESLKEVYIPDGVTLIRDHAFDACHNLETVYIPNSVLKMDAYVFRNCNSLTNIIYKGNINEWYTLIDNSQACSLEYTDAIVYILNPFLDVNGNVFYYDPVIWAYLYDITTGTDDTHFSPVATCTRGQAVTFLWRIFGEEEPTISNPFVDINPNAFYYKAVLWAYENGITTGMDATHFNPEGLLSRNEFVTFLWRTQDKPQPDVQNPFVDVPANMYFTDAVLWAYENGITTGMDATHFAPQELCSRAHIVTFLYRAFAEE